MGLIFCFSACDDKSQNNRSVSNTVPKKIYYQVAKRTTDKVRAKTADPVPKPNTATEIKKIARIQKQQTSKNIIEHYNSTGKLDPFIPLIQEKSQISKSSGNIPKKKKRILTPLEKIELSQIRLVAVIIMKDKSIAMVEEASGKGYEVGIGTYMGKKEGKVSKINRDSIVVRELVKDYKGRLKEQFQEIKLHKMDNEG